jgi:hypothetical protein
MTSYSSFLQIAPHIHSNGALTIHHGQSMLKKDGHPEDLEASVSLHPNMLIRNRT